MNKFDEKMQQIFDIEPEVKELKIPEGTRSLSLINNENGDDHSEIDLTQDLTDAYDQSRENLQEIIEQGKEAMEEILNIAKAGQHPRAFEVYGNLFKNFVEANRELLFIQKQMRDMDKNASNAPTGRTNIDKAIFIGSTTELNKLLKQNTE
jgi:hypothetical protein